MQKNITKRIIFNLFPPYKFFPMSNRKFLESIFWVPSPKAFLRVRSPFHAKAAKNLSEKTATIKEAKIVSCKKK